MLGSSPDVDYRLNNDAITAQGNGACTWAHGVHAPASAHCVHGWNHARRMLRASGPFGPCQ